MPFAFVLRVNRPGDTAKALALVAAISAAVTLAVCSGVFRKDLDQAEAWRARQLPSSSVAEAAASSSRRRWRCAM